MKDKTPMWIIIMIGFVLLALWSSIDGHSVSASDCDAYTTCVQN